MNLTQKSFLKVQDFGQINMAYKLGLKYIDVLGIDNLDYQVEWNTARPYTYSHYDDANYTHYNQALAHPVGSKF